MENVQNIVSSNFQTVGETFAQHYYNQFDNKGTRPALAQLYHNEALLTFEGEKKQGKEAIMAKVMDLPAIGRQITRCDCHPMLPDRILVVILGQVITEGEQNSLGYTHTFVLKGEKDEFSIVNEVFQLNLHNQ